MFDVSMFTIFFVKVAFHWILDHIVSKDVSSSMDRTNIVW